MPSLRQLAALAGVSPSTVTRALRNDSRIGAETRRRIQALATQWHYLPNRLTQSLMTGRSQAIGMLVPSVVNPYSARMLAGVLQQATAAGYRVIIKESHGHIEESLAAIQTFIEQRVDGVLLDTGHLEPLPRQTLLELHSHEIFPIGLDATTVEGALDHVHTDERALALAAIDYLLRLRHTRIAFLGRTVSGQWLGRGLYMRQAFQQRLLSSQHFLDVQASPPYSDVAIENLLDRLCATPTPPTAIIAWEDPLAALVMNALRRRGRRVPQEVSVLGFGNLLFASLLTPALTTFEQHPEQVGEQAVALLLSRLATPGEMDTTAPYQAIAIPPTLITRQSCATRP